MWWTGAFLFVFAAPRLVNSMQVELEQDNDNIQLFIPVAIPDRRAVDSGKSTDDKTPDHDEPYSSIPAYAFSLDTPQAYPRAFGSSYSQPRVELMPSHSLYLGNQPQDAVIKPRSNKNDKNDEQRLRERRHNGCKALARRFSGEARQVLQYLCTELVDIFSTRCDCCEEKREMKAKVTPTFSMPWFGPVGGRRHFDKENELDEAPRQQIAV